MKNKQEKKKKQDNNNNNNSINGTSKYIKPIIPKNFLTIFVFTFVPFFSDLFTKFQISIGQGWGGMARRCPSLAN